MNPRMAIVGVLAIVCGLSAMFLVQAIRRPGAAAVEKVSVVFAAADLKPGETITADMLTTREIPKAEVPEDAMLKITDVVDRAARSNLDQGDLIREKKLAERGAGRGMAALIKTGMRAFTIQTPSFSSSLAGFLQPGNKVDVLLTVNSSGGSDDPSGGATTTTLLQNAEILAVHTQVNTPTSNKIDPDQTKSVTLLVTPDDAALLDLGQNKGTLHLSLRNLKDTEMVKPRQTTIADLPSYRPPTPKPSPVEAPAPAQVVVTAPAGPPPPEFVEIKLLVRTLRGTGSGQDVVTLVRPVPKPPALSPPLRVAGPPS